MDTIKAVNRWWSRYASILLGAAFVFLVAMTILLYIGQKDYRHEIDQLEYTQGSLAQALDNQRQAAVDNGSTVVAPPSKEIKKDPSIVNVPGRQGDPGERGEQGERGSQGVPGTPGSPGPVGPTGPAGPVGPTGPPGADGSNGADGVQGPQGETGPIGPTGPQGPAGRDGANGVDGKDGKDGVDGKSPTEIRIKIGLVTYVCTPNDSDSTVYTCEPEVGDASPETAAYILASGSDPEQQQPANPYPFGFQAAILPGASDRKMLTRVASYR